MKIQGNLINNYNYNKLNFNVTSSKEDMKRLRQPKLSRESLRRPLRKSKDKQKKLKSKWRQRIRKLENLGLF